MQKILVMSTKGHGGLRDEAIGWSAEDGDMLQEGHIGRTPGVRWAYSYATPMHAIGSGWRLLAPPTEHADGEATYYEWWFVRDDDPRDGSAR